MSLIKGSLWLLKIFSALVIGLTFALVAQQVVGFGTMLLIFATVTSLMVILGLLKGFSLGNLLVFDLICVLVGLSLKMYILLAP